MASPNERLLDRFRVVRELGRGGAGVVLEVWDEALDRAVALKFMTPGGEASPERVDRFGREARAAARLKHPGIVAIHEVSEHGPRPFFVMDLVEGQSLADLLEDGGPLSAPEANRIAIDLAEALAYAHDQGVLHRDLKPGNVLVDAGGRVRLCDFGLAKLAEDSLAAATTQGRVMGTPAFMAPEQAAGRWESVDARSDVFALGGVLYALLTGVAPFRGATPEAVLAAVTNAAPPRPRELAPETPADLEAVCLRCLAKDPGDRYPSAAAVREDLMRVLRGEPLRVTPGRRSARWLRRHGKLVGVPTLALIGLALVWAQGPPSPSPAPLSSALTTEAGPVPLDRPLLPAVKTGSQGSKRVPSPADRERAKGLMLDSWLVVTADNHPLAIERLNKILRLDPDQVDAYYLRAKAYCETGKLKEAVADADHYLRVATSATPTNRHAAHIVRARVFLKQGAWEALERAASGSLAALPEKNHWGHVMRGIARAELGEYAEAISDLTAGLEVVVPGIPRNRAFLAVGLARLGLGQPEQALRAIDSGLSILPSGRFLTANLRWRRGQALLALGRHEEAVRDLELAIAVLEVSVHPGPIARARADLERARGGR